MDRASNCSDSGQPVVLVVDDSATMRRSVQMSLTMGGYRVVLASGGSEALRLLGEGLRPQLVLTDIVMPDIDGLALIRQARQMLRFTPIVALTTQGTPQLRQAGKDAGATAWVVKPTGGDALTALVGQFIAKAGR